jgi:hypothetical protein
MRLFIVLLISSICAFSEQNSSSDSFHIYTFPVDNPKLYIDRIDSIQHFVFNDEWILESHYEPFMYTNGRVNLVAVFEYIAGKPSTLNLKYFQFVNLIFSEGKLTGTELLTRYFNNFEDKRIKYENNPAVIIFAEETKYDSVHINGILAHFGFHKRQSLDYNLSEDEIFKFKIRSPKMLNNADIFQTNIWDIPQFIEFKKYYSVDWISLEKSNLKIGMIDSRGYLTRYVIYNVEGEIITGYNLGNQNTWLSLPEIQMAHKIINEELLVGVYSQSLIDTNYRHNFTIRKQSATLTHPNPIAVSIKFVFASDSVIAINEYGSAQSLVSALVKYKSDGSYDAAFRWHDKVVNKSQFVANRKRKR